MRTEWTGRQLSPPKWNASVPADAVASADPLSTIRQPEVAQLQRTAYAQAVRDRVKAVGGIKPRRSEDLRREERYTVYGFLIRKLKLFNDAHLGSELAAPNLRRR